MAVYPVIAERSRITSSLLTSMLPLEAYKASATTRTNDGTLSADPDLQLELEADAVYEVTFDLIYGATLAEDINTEWAVPNAAAGLKGVHGPGSAASDANADNIAMRVGVHGFGTDIRFSGARNGIGLYCYARQWGIVTTDDAGTLALNWCQGTSGATGTLLAAGSFMRAKRIA